MTDETARILAEHGSPRARAEYAIHEATRIYSERCVQATGVQSYDEAMTAIDRAKRERSGALTGALIAWDTESTPGDPDGYLISRARDLVSQRGRSVFDQWCARVLVRPQIPAGHCPA